MRRTDCPNDTDWRGFHGDKNRKEIRLIRCTVITLSSHLQNLPYQILRMFAHRMRLVREGKRVREDPLISGLHVL